VKSIKECRQDFPMLQKKMHGKPLVYFDSAATALKPQSVIDAITDFYTCNYGTVHRAVYQLAVESTRSYDESRSTIQKFINASSLKEVIFISSATAGINLVAYSYGRKFVEEGDNVIISEIEHHANIVPWQILCEDKGANLRVIRVDDNGDLDLKHYQELLDSKTKIVSLAHVSNSVGSLHPIKKITQLAHQQNAIVCLDAAQSIAHRPVDVQDLDVDFLVFSAHKLYGPTGIGILYGKQGLLEKMPPFFSGGDMIDRVTFKKTSYSDLPVKFEAGTPNIAGALGLKAAIDYVTDLGFKEIMSYESHLLKKCEDALKTIKEVKIIGNPKKREAVISFIVEGFHPLDVGTFLDLKGYALRTGHHCAQTAMDRFGVSHTLRLSLAFYNTEDEVDGFIQALKDVISDLKS
jgi:cysteine desulfurase / selenocysteine lyase